VKADLLNAEFAPDCAGLLCSEIERLVLLLLDIRSKRCPLVMADHSEYTGYGLADGLAAQLIPPD
jgi:hypothetical protein